MRATTLSCSTAPNCHPLQRGPSVPYPGRITSIVADVTDASAVGDAVSPGTDIVILGAAVTADAARDARDPETTLRVNLLAQVPILEAARRVRACDESSI